MISDDTTAEDEANATWQGAAGDDDDDDDDDESAEAAAASGKPKGMMSAFRGLVSTRSLWNLPPPALVPPQLTTPAYWGGLSGLLAALRTRHEPPRRSGRLRCGLEA